MTPTHTVVLCLKSVAANADIVQGCLKVVLSPENMTEPFSDAVPAAPRLFVLSWTGQAGLTTCG